MNYPSKAAAAGRAAQIGKLLQVIDRAQEMAWRLGMIEARSRKAIALYFQLETIRVEIESMNVGDASRQRPWPLCGKSAIQ